MDASGKADFSVTKPIYLSDITSALEQAKQLIEHRKVAKVNMSASANAVEVQLSEPTDFVKFVM